MGEPLAFLAVQDIARLHAVSFRHTVALRELGFGPPDILRSESEASDSDLGSDDDYGSSLDTDTE